jgi:aminoglycoside phosphotransferase family enzyme/predicted kinase
VAGITLVETHISWVLLTGEIAYKIKRPVCYSFLDLRLLERRAFFCQEELRLNRRFAPQLYRDVCPISMVDGAARMGGTGEPIEYAVKMRQFPRDEELDNLLARGAIGPAELEIFGRDLAAIHEDLPVAQPQTPWGDALTAQQVISNNLEECSQASSVFGGTSAVQALQPELQRRLQSAVAWMADRRQGGRVRECHGDLHAANIVRLESRLIAFDCLEFEPAFRWIDVAEEVAFLLADLDARGCPQHEHAFLSGYLGHSGDYQACRLLPLYKAHRALVRAKVVALRQAADTESRQEDTRLSSYRAYLDCTARAVSRQSPRLILMSGLSGSGKTWLAERLAPILRAVHLRSDVERKRLAGIGELERTDSTLGEGIYARAFTVRVYAHLAEAANDVLSGGYSAIIDGTFSRGEDRNSFRDLARRIGVPACLVQCNASQGVLRHRIAERARLGHDASEAGLEVLEWQEEHFEPIAADEQWAVISVETADVDLANLGRRISALGAA